MPRSLLLVFSLPLVAMLPVPAADKEDNEKRILKLFVSEFISITPGKGKFPASFSMGTNAKDGAASESPAVTVTLKKPFAIARYEVTQELYELVMGTNPARWKGKKKPDGTWTGTRNSVEMLTHAEAVSFCAKVTKLLRKHKLITANQAVRLPSEAEWEYCCRAGTRTRFSFGDKEDDLGTYAWFQKNSKNEDPPVGKKKPNAWGLHECHGYVWEWVADSWHDSHKDAPTDGSARTKKDSKEFVIRGGSFADPAKDCSSTARQGKPGTTKSDRIGFRCVLETVKKETGK